MAAGCAALATLVSPRVVAQSAPPPETMQAPLERDALEVCIALTEPDSQQAANLASDAQLRNPANHIERQDLSGKDLAGKTFRGKVLADVNLKGARLRGADLTDAVICHGDLRDADLVGAHLDRALIGGSTELDGANLAHASARALQIANAYGAVRIDGADLRAARIACDPINRGAYCQGDLASIVSMRGADLRGAIVDHLCCRLRGLGAARLDGVTTQPRYDEHVDFAQLAAGAGAGRIALVPNYFYSGRRAEFTGAELRRLPAVLARMTSASVHPSFPCSRAVTRVEKAICADPRLAALDSALNWLWQRVEHTSRQIAAQRAWLRARGDCPPRDENARALVSAADPRGCIWLNYAERIEQLAPSSSPPTIERGTYTTDQPLDLPSGRYSRLAEKYLLARGFRRDEIIVEGLQNGAGRISGGGVHGNGHMCGFSAPEGDVMARVGARFRITDPGPDDDQYGVTFVITPQVVLWVGGNMQFQCGARGGWAVAYFRQPDRLIARVKTLLDPQ